MKVYFAAPLFCNAEKEFNLNVTALLEEAGYDVFLPQRDGFENIDDVTEVPHVESVEDVMNEIFEIDRKAVIDSDVVVAVLDGIAVDEGVAVEMGIAYEQDIPVVGLKTDRRVFAAGEPYNAMIYGLMHDIVEDPANLVGRLESMAL